MHAYIHTYTKGARNKSLVIDYELLQDFGTSCTAWSWRPDGGNVTGRKKRHTDTRQESRGWVGCVKLME